MSHVWMTLQEKVKYQLMTTEVEGEVFRYLDLSGSSDPPTTNPPVEDCVVSLKAESSQKESERLARTSKLPSAERGLETLAAAAAARLRLLAAAADAEADEVEAAPWP